MQCSHCLNDEFRSSRLRVSDVLQLLMFRMPVRCTRCHRRQFAPVSVVRKDTKIRKDRRKAA